MSDVYIGKEISREIVIVCIGRSIPKESNILLNDRPNTEKNKCSIVRIINNILDQRDPCSYQVEPIGIANVFFAECSNS
jgi:hypothetical protein